MAVEVKENIRKEAKRDILELNNKIGEFVNGKIPEDKFKHFRLTRGVYGQRQTGVQMIRIKLPYGRFTTRQLSKMADVSEQYATGNLHLTTRQDIQLHFVKLKDAPQLWSNLEEEEITLREACGNTVRNVTASADAGVNPREAFDVTPYAHEFAYYFLRNPICQDMGRKFKVAFSSSEEDSAFTYFHDLGFIPKIKNIDGKEVRGFKVVIGGGLGAQSIVAQTLYEFLEEDQYIPLAEAVLRVFDRHGERAKRFKARMKFLIQKIGLDAFMELVEEERTALKNKTYRVDRSIVPEAKAPEAIELPKVEVEDRHAYEAWRKTNVFEQKQKDFYGVYLRVLKGDVSSETARDLNDLVEKYAADDIRVTVNQGLLLRFVREEALPVVYSELKKLGLANPGFDSTHDITACPGSDTCNLAVTDSTTLTQVLEGVLRDEYEDLIYENNLKIKISGCMNSCGQHMAASIGFHGSSIKKDKLVAPAMQVVLGGGVDPVNGVGDVADKVIKVPTKRIPEVLRFVLNDYEERAVDGEYFNHYYRRLGKRHFYDLLKPLADSETLKDEEFVDWGSSELFKPEIGTGECAGITLDVVGTVINEAQEKLGLAEEGLEERVYADAIYNSYSAFVIGAKALLLSVDKQCNTQANIIADFNQEFYVQGNISLNTDFESLVYQINQHEPTEPFAKSYCNDAKDFLNKVRDIRQQQLDEDKAQEDKKVIENYYKA